MIVSELRAVFALHLLLARLAGFARLRGEGQSRRQRLREELRLPGGSRVCVRNCW